jgi:hypothetical protein
MNYNINMDSIIAGSIIFNYLSTDSTPLKTTTYYIKMNDNINMNNTLAGSILFMKYF